MRCSLFIRGIVLALTALGASPTLLRAQFPAEAQAGARVRVWLPEARRQDDGPARWQLLRGTIAAVAPDTLRLTVPGTTGMIAIPRSGMRRLELSRGEPSRPASAVGRAVGGAIGSAALWALMNDPRRSGGPHYRTDWRAAGVGAAWGGGIGALSGLLWPHEGWRRVRLPK